MTHSGEGARLRGDKEKRGATPSRSLPDLVEPDILYHAAGDPIERHCAARALDHTSQYDGNAALVPEGGMGMVVTRSSEAIPDALNLQTALDEVLS